MKKILLWAMVLLCSTNALAEEKARVLLMNLKTAGVDENTANLIGDLMAVKLSKNNQIDVVNSSDIKRMIELESDKERAGCDDDSCLADLAGALGARYVIYGTLGKLGSRYVTTLNLFDAELGKAINRSDVQADSMDVVSDRLDAALQDLIAPIAVANSSTLAEGDDLGALQNAEGASSNALEPNAPSAGANPFSLLLMGGGGLIFGLSYASSLFLSGVTPLVAVPVAGPLFVPFFGDASNFNPANFSVCCTCSAVQAAGLGLLLGGWLLSGGDKKSEPKTPDDQAFFLAPAAPSLSMAY